MERMGIILSGAGVFDGSDVDEAVLCRLSIDRAGAQAICMAPNKNQTEVIDHRTKRVASETRNCLTESARVARGQIRDLREVHATVLDAVIIPGGYGPSKNLSDFTWKGEQCWVDGEVSRLLREMFDAKKPIGAINISSALLAKIFSSEKPRLTVGSSRGPAEKLLALGTQHVQTRADEIVVDERFRFVSTPGYLMSTRLTEVAVGIDRLVSAILRLIRARVVAPSFPARAGGSPGAPAYSGDQRRKQFASSKKVNK